MYREAPLTKEDSIRYKADTILRDFKKFAPSSETIIAYHGPDSIEHKRNVPVSPYGKLWEAKGLYSEINDHKGLNKVGSLFLENNVLHGARLTYLEAGNAEMLLEVSRRAIAPKDIKDKDINTAHKALYDILSIEPEPSSQLIRQMNNVADEWVNLFLYEKKNNLYNPEHRKGHLDNARELYAFTNSTRGMIKVAALSALEYGALSLPTLQIYGQAITSAFHKSLEKKAAKLEEQIEKHYALHKDSVAQYKANMLKVTPEYFM